MEEVIAVANGHPGFAYEERGPNNYRKHLVKLGAEDAQCGKPMNSLRQPLDMSQHPMIEDCACCGQVAADEAAAQSGPTV